MTVLIIEYCPSEAIGEPGIGGEMNVLMYCQEMVGTGWPCTEQVNVALVVTPATSVTFSGGDIT